MLGGGRGREPSPGTQWPRADLVSAASLPWIGYALVLGARGALRWEHVIVAALVTTVAAGGPRARTFFIHALPFFVLFLLYDSMRYWRDVGVDPSRVLGCDLRAAELAWFGFESGGSRVTLNDFFATHHHPAIDLLCAIPYGSYIPVMVATFLWLYARDRPTAMRFAWMALATHLLGFITYHVAPAAPPWYVRARGCVVDAAATNSAAGLQRVDALLGVSYFHALYARGSAVFGALPSLHVTYPLYGLFATFRSARPAARAVQIVYAAVMAFAAIYLDHHYVFDVLLGLAYALIAFAAVSWYFREPAAIRPPTGRTEGSCRGS